MQLKQAKKVNCILMYTTHLFLLDTGNKRRSQLGNKGTEQPRPGNLPIRPKPRNSRNIQPRIPDLKDQINRAIKPSEKKRRSNRRYKDRIASQTEKTLPTTYLSGTSLNQVCDAPDPHSRHHYLRPSNYQASIHHHPRSHHHYPHSPPLQSRLDSSH